MHEYSIVQALIERVAQEAAAKGASRVRRLRVSIGDLAGVERGLLATAYDTFKAGTVCESSDLEIRAVPARWECPVCYAERAVGEILRCPEHDAPAQLVRGDEIILERIEMEIPDV